MTTLKIIADSPLNPADKQLLIDGAAPHQILFPAKTVTSVLGTPEPDPSFAEADVAFGQPDWQSIKESKNLKWIQVSSAGFTRYDTPEFRALVKERGMIVTNSSSVYAQACADHVFAFMLANSRRLPEALASQTANATPEWFKLRGDSISLRGQSVVILGFGTIALELVKLLAPYQMRITAMRRTPRGDEGIPVVTPDELPTALATADHVINILPENSSSIHFMNATRFAAMKPGAIFHNIGRGTTVDQSALLETLRSGHLAAAWLDVTDPEPLPAEHPLRHEPNCHITPHTAGGHANETTTLVRHFITNLQRFQQGSPLLDQVM